MQLTTFIVSSKYHLYLANLSNYVTIKLYMDKGHLYLLFSISVSVWTARFNELSDMFT